jgi:hypothetical protein
MKYITVVNNVNKISTVHLASCWTLGDDPMKKTPSAERAFFDDGFDAALYASEAYPVNNNCCGHCLQNIKDILKK